MKLKKLVKGWMVFLGVSYTANAFSNELVKAAEALEECKSSGGTKKYSDVIRYEFVWKDTLRNFKEWWRIVAK